MSDEFTDDDVTTDNIIDMHTRQKRPHQAGTVQEAIALLAECGTIEYEGYRKTIAKEWGLRESVLDREVEELRAKLKVTDADPFGWAVEPAVEEIGTAALLDQIADVISRYVSMEKTSADAVALWVVYCWAFDRFNHSPLLALTSPEKRCGKSTLLGTVSALVPRPLASSGITAAAVFRAVEAWQPTLLVDELDSFMENNDELRGVLNSGHSRYAAFVIRNVEVKGSHEPRKFSTWCPKLLARIGTLPDTLEDRSIHILMRRKRPGEKLARLRNPMLDTGMGQLRRQCARWAIGDAVKLAGIDIDPPDSLNDRAQDNWRPLFTIAALAGQKWMDRVTAAVLTISGEKLANTDSTGTMLLADIKIILGDKDKISSEYLCAQLNMMEHRPWPEWRRGKPMTTIQLAKLLRPHGISPANLWIDGRTVKGYSNMMLEEEFERYLDFQPARPLGTASNQHFPLVSDPLGNEDLAGTKTAENPHQISTPSGLAARKQDLEEMPELPTFLDRKKSVEVDL
jgi:putative DNA primase/helicase